jgi:hypothetical protein
MSLRKPCHPAVHLLVIAALVLAGVVAPVAAAHEALASVSSAHAATDMPCGDMAGMKPATATDPCAKAHCSLAVCLGAAACLPEVLRVTACVPATDRLGAPDAPFVATGAIDTPLRPPIA